MSQTKEIFEGFVNLVFPDEKVEGIANTRLKICFECPVRTGNKCDKNKGGCGCYLAAKARSPTSQCPKSKW